MLDQLKQQQLTLLARKALLQDELRQIEQALGQLGAIISFASAPAPEPAPEQTPTE